jgi:hypothetical protein
MNVVRGPVFIQFTGPLYPVFDKLFGPRLGRALTRHIALNGRARSPEFMRELAAAHGAGTIVTIAAPAELPALPPGSDAVLLWPDANGLGWRPIEKKLLRGGVRVWVLSGRRRRFELTRRCWRAFEYRRVLEKYLVGEMVFAAAFLLMTPFLTVWDLLRGRK